ncbi:MAG: septal ring lytic transglycosylase RlpA family protein [Bacteroidia bacterium]|nr:septal ring lytic transglycosylase RlpA family protein [Bacteroidia bacterium]
MLFIWLYIGATSQTDTSGTSTLKPDTIITIALKPDTGIASFYARAFEGRKCSNGEIFRHDSLTAAHKTLKFGTRVRVTNLKNDSVIVVKINDRLPKNSKRSIDLTKRGAKQLNFVLQGLTRVKLEVLRDSLVPKQELQIKPE